MFHIVTYVVTPVDDCLIYNGPFDLETVVQRLFISGFTLDWVRKWAEDPSAGAILPLDSKVILVRETGSSPKVPE